MGGRLACMPSPLDDDGNLSTLKGWTSKDPSRYNYPVSDIDNDDGFLLSTGQVKKFYALWEKYSPPGPEIHVQGSPMEYLYLSDQLLNDKTRDQYTHMAWCWNPDADLPPLAQRAAVPKDKYLRSKYVVYSNTSLVDPSAMFPNGASTPVTAGLMHPATLVLKHGEEEKAMGQPLRLLRMPVAALATLDPIILAAFKRYWENQWKNEWTGPRTNLCADRDLAWAHFLERNPDAQREDQAEHEEAVLAQWRRSEPDLSPARAVCMEQWCVQVDRYRQPVSRRCTAYFAAPDPKQFDGGEKWTTLIKASVEQRYNGERFAGYSISARTSVNTNTPVVAVASLPHARR